MDEAREKSIAPFHDKFANKALSAGIANLYCDAQVCGLLPKQ